MSSHLETARRFGRYVLLDLVGVGATSQVWAAHPPSRKGERVAIKISRRGLDAQAHEATDRELRALAAAKHAAIVEVTDTVHDGERIGLVMELCRGSLADWLRIHGPLPAYWVARVGIDALAGLEAAHAAGVLHRDVKPGNLLVAQDGSIKIADFGIAKILEHGTTGSASSALLGTMPFVAPERRYGRAVDARADLYGVAATLACLAVGDVVGELFVPVVRERLEARLPTALCDVLVRAGAYAPDERFPDARTMAAALRDVLDGLPGREAIRLTDLSRPPTLDTHAPTDQDRGTPRLRPRARLVVVGLAVLASGFALGTAVRTKPSTPSATAPAELPPCAAGAKTVRSVVRLGPRETSAGLAHDLDADGLVDVVFVNQLDESLSIYWGSEGEPLRQPVRVEVGRTSERPAVGDLDGDGRTDLLLAMTDGAQFLVLRGTSDRGFSPAGPVFQAPAPGRTALVDWDADGALDLLFQTVGGDHCTAWRRGRGDGTFEPHACIGMPSDLLDPYGHYPLAVYRRSEGGELVRHLRARDGALGPSEHVADLVSLGAGSASHFVVRDLDGDGVDEVFGPALGRRESVLLRIDSAGACEVWPRIAFNPNRLADVADIDGDGLIDVVAHDSCGGCESNHVVILGVPG